MDWAKILKDEGRYSPLVRADEFGKKYGIDPASLRTTLHRQQARGLVERVTHKVYVNHLAANFAPTDLLQVLRPKSYVSLESALRHWGISTQSPSRLTCLTTGPPREYRTKSFTIVFRSISPKLFWGFVEKRTRYASYNIAEAEKALLDWVYLSLRGGTNPPLDELDFKLLSRSKLVKYAQKYPRSVLTLLLYPLATEAFAA